MIVETVKLSEIAEVRLGRQRSPKNHSGPSNRQYLRAANVGWNGLLLDDVKQMNFTGDEMTVYRLKPFDLLLNEASGSAAEVGKPVIWMGELDDCAFQNTLLRVRPGPSVDPRYLLQYLRTQASSGAFARDSRGVGIHHLGREALAKWPIPLPPLAEQCRIAAILDHADAILAKQRKVVANFALFHQAAFDNLAREASTTQPLSKLGIDFTSGKSVLGTDADRHPTNRIIKVSAISSGVFDASEAKPMPGTYQPPSKHRVLKGDILFGRASGSLDLLGATAVVEQECDNLYLPDKVWKLDVSPSAPVIPDFVLGVLRSDDFRAFIRHHASGAAGVRNIAKSTVLRYEAPLVPIARQRTYADLAAVARHQERRAAATVVLQGQLLASLQSRAFSGLL
jgi:type I restriction enzyme S subunit